MSNTKCLVAFKTNLKKDKTLTKECLILEGITNVKRDGKDCNESITLFSKNTSWLCKTLEFDYNEEHYKLKHYLFKAREDKYAPTTHMWVEENNKLPILMDYLEVKSKKACNSETTKYMYKSSTDFAESYIKLYSKALTELKDKVSNPKILIDYCTL